MSDIEVVSAAITTDGVKAESRILLTQRLSTKRFPYLWECPGGKVEAGESHEDALRRELKEELGLDHIVIAGNPIWRGTIDIAYDGGHAIVLSMFSVIISGPPLPQEGQGIGWFTVMEMQLMYTMMTPGNVAALRALFLLLNRCDMTKRNVDGY